MAFVRDYPLLATDTTLGAITKIASELSSVYVKVNQCRTLFLSATAPAVTEEGALWLYPDTVNTNYILYVYVDGAWKVLPLWTIGPLLPDADTVFDGHVHIQTVDVPVCWVKENGTWVENFHFNGSPTPETFSTPILDSAGNFDTSWISIFNPYDLSDFDEETPLEMEVGDRALYQNDAPVSGEAIIIPIKMDSDNGIYRFVSFGCNNLHPDIDNPELATIKIGSGESSFGFGFIINGTALRGGIVTAYRIDDPGYIKETSSFSTGINWAIMGVLSYSGLSPIRFYVERLC